MKKIIWALFIAVSCGAGYGQNNQILDREWKATVNVIDDAGQPVSGADVRIGYYVPAAPSESIGTVAKRGKTDENGVFAASERSRSVDLLFGVSKEGFYDTHLQYELGAPYQYDPVKWNPNVTLVLKRVLDPIPMYAKWIKGVRLSSTVRRDMI